MSGEVESHKEDEKDEAETGKQNQQRGMSEKQMRRQWSTASDLQRVQKESDRNENVSSISNDSNEKVIDDFGKDSFQQSGGTEGRTNRIMSL